MNDNEEMTSEAEMLIKNHEVWVTFEVIAECNLDFVDCVLYAYHSVRQYEIKTFDKKLNKLLSQI